VLWRLICKYGLKRRIQSKTLTAIHHKISSEKHGKIEAVQAASKCRLTNLDTLFDPTYYGDVDGPNSLLVFHSFLQLYDTEPSIFGALNPSTDPHSPRTSLTTNPSHHPIPGKFM
jgi:hypothetical protein